MRKFEKEIVGYNIHKYAPELNEVIFKSGNKIRFSKVSLKNPEGIKDIFKKSEIEMFKGVKLIKKIYTRNENEKEFTYRWTEEKAGLFNSTEELIYTLKKFEYKKYNNTPCKDWNGNKYFLTVKCILKFYHK